MVSSSIAHWRTFRWFSIVMDCFLLLFKLFVMKISIQSFLWSHWARWAHFWSFLCSLPKSSEPEPASRPWRSVGGRSHPLSPAASGHCQSSYVADLMGEKRTFASRFNFDSFWYYWEWIAFHMSSGHSYFSFFAKDGCVVLPGEAGRGGLLWPRPACFSTACPLRPAERVQVHEAFSRTPQS